MLTLSPRPTIRSQAAVVGGTARRRLVVARWSAVLLQHTPIILPVCAVVVVCAIAWLVWLRRKA